MTIRRAQVADLARLAECARAFYASSRFLTGFDLARFVGVWTQLLESGAGAVFVLEDSTRLAPGVRGEEPEIAGAIGGLAYGDIYSGEQTATEMFWFVMPEARGGGLRLYRAFEEWARECGCRRIRMVHLMDSMPEKLRRVYERLGFEAVEVHYAKELPPSP